MAYTRRDLNEIYKAAAQKAFEDGIDPGNENQLIDWLEKNCNFNPDYLFFLILGVGSELADIIAQHEGYADQVDKIWKERIEPKFEFNRNLGVWQKRV